MADEELTTQSLPEFIRNCIDDLHTNTLSSEEAFFAMQQYKPLRELLETNKDNLTRVLQNPEETKKILLAILTQESTKAIKEADPLDDPRSPAEIAARAKAFAEAKEQIPQTSAQRFEQKRKEYARVVARNYIDTLRKNRIYAISQTQEEQIVAQTVNAATSASTDTQQAVTNSLQEVVPVTNTATLRQIAKTTSLATQFDMQQEVTTGLLASSALIQPAVFMSVAAQGVPIEQAVSLAGIASAFTADVSPAIDITRPSRFFQSTAKTGLQKVLAPAADAFLTVLPQETREQIIEGVLKNSWGNVSQKFEELKTGLNETQLHLLSEAIRKGNQSFGGQAGAPSAAAGVSKVTSDLLSSMFGSGIDQEMINKYLGLGKSAQLPDRVAWQQFYAGIVMDKNPGMFGFAFAGGRWLLNFAGTKAIGGLAKKAVGGRIGMAIGGFLGGFLGPVGVAMGGFIGNFVGGKVIGSIWGGIKTFFGGGLLTRLMSGEGDEKFGLLEWVVLAIILIPILLVFLVSGLFQSGMNFALADKGFNVPSNLGNASPFAPHCANGPNWPMTGTIFQGPYTPGGTHATLNAIDIDNENWTPVYAALGGTITTAFKGCAVGAESTKPGGCGGYGNHLVIEGADASGNHFNTIYGHLADFAPGISDGTVVKACQLIAYSDDNGVSSGPHLHFEYNGGVKLSDPSTPLPYPIPSCIDSSNDINCRVLLGDKWHITAGGGQ